MANERSNLLGGGGVPYGTVSAVKRRNLLIGGVVFVVVAIALAIGLGVGLSHNGSHDDNGGGQPVWGGVRLPSSVQPVHYTLAIMPELSANPPVFTGSLRINITVSEPTWDIALHTVNHKFSSILICARKCRGLSNGLPIEIRQVPEWEYIVLRSNQQFLPGVYEIYVAYTGTMSNDLLGFYRSSYADANGTTHYLATTKFEPTYARRAFPCFDEPAMKATYSFIALVLDQSTTPVVLSNTPEITDRRIDGVPVTTVGGKSAVAQARYFMETPKMSTYLVAFVFSDFEAITSTFNQNKNISVWTRKGSTNVGAFALDVGRSCIQNYTAFFGIDYPLPKQDLIGIPDFQSGALEDWGSILFRETSFLIDPAVSSQSDLQNVALTVCHELVHQWFGNLVTMNWWNDLWLNEGFASFLEWYGVQNRFPEWQVPELFYADPITNALEADSLTASHPITANVTDPAQINILFDSITYDKGATVLHMLSNFLTVSGSGTALSTALHNYLTNFMYGTALTADLWAYISAASGKDIKTIMSSWTDITGYPVVTFIKKEIEGVSYLVGTQKRFLQYTSGTEMSAKDAQSLWWIPLDYVTDANPTTIVSAPIELSATSPAIPYPTSTTGWVKFNVGQHSLYRVNYEAEIWARLQGAAALKVLAPLDRAGLVSDSLSLLRTGDLAPETAFEFVFFAKQDNSYAVWAALLGKLSVFEVLLRSQLTGAAPTCYNNFTAYVQSMVEPALYMLGGVNSTRQLSHPEALLRSALVAAAVFYNDPDTIALCRQMYLDSQASGVDIAADIRSAVYSGAIVSDVNDPNDTVYNMMLAKYIRSDTFPAEKVRITAAFASSVKASILQKTLAMSIDPAQVKPQDTTAIVTKVARNPIGQPLAWDFMKQNWDLLFANFGSRMGTLVGGVTQDFVTLERAQDVTAFFQAHPAPSANGAISGSLERIRSNAYWLGLHTQATCTYFAGL
eukprot:Opistho-2@89261